MNTTPASLLLRLREPADQAAWARFVQLYAPLLYQWVGRAGLEGADADDLVQDIFMVLLRKLPEFRYDPSKSFRGWLRTVALNKLRELKRRRVVAAGPLVEEPGAADPAEEFWDHDYRHFLVRRALDIMRTDFPETTWQACWLLVMEGKSAAEVAQAQGTTPGAVHAAKFRVLTRLRQELAGLLD
ncbi:MAG: sigma-70 family RNA polymerase sigma factor [Gemmataceae bacterium]|nr:sigma-70 family RNA polymerase sigma factor [Gemmataceae bacterium]